MRSISVGHNLGSRTACIAFEIVKAVLLVVSCGYNVFAAHVDSSRVLN